MVITRTDELEAGTVSSYDRISELKAFDDSKAGVQGLVENGVTKVPRMFYCEHTNDSNGSTSEPNSKFSIPTIVNQIQSSVINHGIPSDVLDEMIKGTGRFHQQDAKARKEYYTRDPNRKVVYVSNYSLYHDPAATWRDTLCCVMTPHPPEAGELSAQQIGGLQVLHDNQWVDVTPIHGALVINIGDLLQLLTNDKFISVKHRVLANHIGPRISVASLFRKDGDDSLVYGPNKELLSEVNPPLYRDVSLKEYLTYYYAKGIGTSGPSHF
ncbi:hypothetical protein JHK82_043801 [Glycine max]|nr:hypothetical protein JHK86_043681 [Glycine max]KAG4957966.1 hypothetical protein JHK85_044346 [Glycine max]KAG5106831.1 hypothetical protein JHK82_043801 [Glycine max]